MYYNNTRPVNDFCVTLMLMNKRPEPTRGKSADKKPSHKQRKDNGDNDNWRNVWVWLIPLIFAVFLAAAFSFHNAIAVWCGVASAAILIAYALFLLEWYVLHENSHRRIARSACALLIATSLGIGVWQGSRLHSNRSWLVLNGQERQGFINVLAAQYESREKIRLGCPAAREDICVLVTPFIEAFKLGHFIVENDRVDRVIPGKPSTGVVLFKYGHADGFNPQDPSQGIWVTQTRSLNTVAMAFKEIGINAGNAADQNMPVDVIGVYFGIESPQP